MKNAVDKVAGGIVDAIREDREATEALIAKMEADHAAEVERLTVERDAAVARAEKAEEWMARLINHCNKIASMMKYQAIDNFVYLENLYGVQTEAEQYLAALAAAPDKPQYAPEPLGGVEGEEK